MPHGRQQIRDALKTLLTGLVTTGANVHANRVHRLQRSDLPALLISIEGEESDLLSQASLAMARQPAVLIEAVVQGNDAIDDDLDTICAEVEAAVGTDATLGGRTKGPLVLTSTEFSFDSEADVPMARAAMHFAARFHTASGDAATLI